MFAEMSRNILWFIAADKALFMFGILVFLWVFGAAVMLLQLLPEKRMSIKEKLIVALLWVSPI